MEQRIIDLVNQRHEKSGGSCGLSFVELLTELQITYDDFKPLISAMHKAKIVRVRKGINGYLVMKPKQ